MNIQKLMHDKLRIHFFEHCPTVKIRQYKTRNTWVETSVHEYKCKYCGLTFELDHYVGEKIRLMA